jgi:dimethylhistidine N-methyltransferase
MAVLWSAAGKRKFKQMNLPAPVKTSEIKNSAAEEFRRDILSGLLGFPKTLPCKYLYDEIGSRLFEKICKTPEYYLTRTEVTLLREACPKAAQLIGPDAEVIEPGSGAGEKVRILLDALARPRAFLPVDISKGALWTSVHQLRKDYPGVEIHPLVADFTKPFHLPNQNKPHGARRVIFFPGSTISNFAPDAATKFLAQLRTLLSAGDFLFIGVDRVKDTRTLECAYDDAQGVTAAFNLNLIRRIARELEVKVDPSTFRHRAVYNEKEARIEMHLHSEREQTIEVCGHEIEFREGESIHTENSYKYTPERFISLAEASGYHVVETFTDERKLFSLYLCAVPG